MWMLYRYCISNTWQCRDLDSFETQMSITFIFCKLQIHHHVELSPVAVKEIKPERSGKEGGFSLPVCFP